MKLPKFRLFDYETEGPGVRKDEPEKKGLARFWDILSTRFWKLVSLNAIYLVFSIPGFIIRWFATYVVLALFFSEIMTAESQGAQAITQLCMYISCFIYALFGGGAPGAGMTYVIRNYTKYRHSWVWADFWEKLKENFLKGSAVFLIDTVILFLLGVNFWFYGLYAGENIASYLLQGLMVVIFLIFLLMHAYIYPIMISFDKKVWEIYKYSFILAIGKLPTTFLSMALVSLISGVVIYLAFFVTVYAMLLIPVILFTFITYVNLFITYPVVERYMVLPKERDKA
ncbi:MAG: YesL family protein [Clostridia bacterium]